MVDNIAQRKIYMSEQKYYPLSVIEGHWNMAAGDAAEKMLDMFKDNGYADKTATVDDLYGYIFGTDFFSPEYAGPFKRYNDMILYNRRTNRELCPNLRMEDVKERSTEWKDMTAIGLVLTEWSKMKMAYKVDNDFFHEIKNTENLTVTRNIYEKLPYRTLFIDLTEVKDISGFKGVWVMLVKDRKTEKIGINILMCRGETEYTFFSHYSWIDFHESEEAKLNLSELPESQFIVRNFCMSGVEPVSALSDPERAPYLSVKEADIRPELVMATLQILQFIAMDASDIAENQTTKRTYKPSATVKNKFSGVRMWDVGVRYGKAIRTARDEYRKRIRGENTGNETQKNRKPTRPHVRRAHWHKFRIGKGRTELTTHWIAPVFVCGNGQEIPVTIHELKK